MKENTKRNITLVIAVIVFFVGTFIGGAIAVHCNQKVQNAKRSPSVFYEMTPGEASSYVDTSKVTVVSGAPEVT